MWGWSYNGNWWDWVGMSIMMMLMWLPLLAALVWLIGRGNAPQRRGPDRDPEPADPRDLARRAYARGDLERERYLQIIADLEDTPAQPKSA